MYSQNKSDCIYHVLPLQVKSKNRLAYPQHAGEKLVQVERRGQEAPPEGQEGGKEGRTQETRQEACQRQEACRRQEACSEKDNRDQDEEGDYDQEGHHQKARRRQEGHHRQEGHQESHYQKNGYEEGYPRKEGRFPEEGRCQKARGSQERLSYTFWPPLHVESSVEIRDKTWCFINTTHRTEEIPQSLLLEILLGPIFYFRSVNKYSIYNQVSVRSDFSCSSSKILPGTDSSIHFCVSAVAVEQERTNVLTLSGLTGGSSEFLAAFSFF